MELDILDQVLDYYKESKWRELLQLNQSNNYNKLMWVWPSENNLKFIKDIVDIFQVQGIISIGCGCGLLEWILHQYTGLPMKGYEINQEWWASKYSNPQFIKLEFPKQPPTSEILTPNYALLFCYFNDGETFKKYVECYKGNLIFIIGPGFGAGRHTNPEPFKPDFGSKYWVLYKSEEVRDTKDFIAAYVYKKI